MRAARQHFLPGLSGVELLARVRERRPEVPVVVISGIDDEGHARGLLALGGFAYLVKPFRLGEVEAVVARAVGSRAGASAEDVK